MRKIIKNINTVKIDISVGEKKLFG